jgi:hypothetical protein
MTKAAELAKMGEVLTNSQIGGRRNMIINGGMNVFQRSTSATDLGASNGYFSADRFRIFSVGTAGRVTMSQSSDTPEGFGNSLKIDVTTADTSIAADELFILSYAMEGQDAQMIKKGTSEAESLTMSFYAKANASANYVVEMYDQDNTRNNTQAFTVTDSWQRFSFTFAPDTTGALDDDNALSFYPIQIWLHGGSDYTSGTFASNTWGSVTNANRYAGSRTSIFDSTDREFYVTGVQVEIGSQATPFEHRSFGEELALCQRYYHEQGNYPPSPNSGYEGFFVGASFAASGVRGVMYLPTTMRATPTFSTSGSFALLGGSAGSVTAIALADSGGNPAVALNVSTSSTTSGEAYELRSDNDQDARVQFDAEL